jgi:hypothetical protein
MAKLNSSAKIVQRQRLARSYRSYSWLSGFFGDGRCLVRVKMRRTRIEHILSALPPLATEERTFGIGSLVQILLQKSFCSGDQKFSGL